MRYEPCNWYSVPFYDAVFDPLADEEAVFADAAYHRYARLRPGRRRVLEPACGSGRILAGLMSRGWEACGFDVNEHMVARAKARLPAARITHQSMQSFRVRRGFDLAVNMVSTFRHLSTDDDALAHLAGVAGALRPGGIFLLGLHLSDYSREKLSRERWLGRHGRAEVVCNIQRWPPIRRTRRERARARYVVTERGARRGYECNWTFRCYDDRQLAALIAREPRFTHVATYGFDFDIDAPVDTDERLDRVLVLKKQQIKRD